MRFQFQVNCPLKRRHVSFPEHASFIKLSPLLNLAILCAGVTSYKAIKESEVRAGDFLCIIGAGGGLGHLAVQYGRVMGCRVIAVDVGQEKLDFCLSLGAEFVFDCSDSDQLVEKVKHCTEGGAHVVINIAAHPSAYEVAVRVCRRNGMVVLVAMPKESVSFDVVHIILNRITLRGSIVGTRQDMKEAMDFARRGLVRCRVEVRELEEINEVMKAVLENKVIGRVVLNI